MAQTVRARLNWSVKPVGRILLSKSEPRKWDRQVNGYVAHPVSHDLVIHRRIAHRNIVHVHAVHRHSIHVHVSRLVYMTGRVTVRVLGGLCKTALTSDHARAKCCRKHVTKTGHYEQQCKTSWKESFHLRQLKLIIAYPIQSANPERLFGTGAV